MFIFLFLVSFIFLDPSNNTNFSSNENNGNILGDDKSPNVAANVSILQDPFTENFEDMRGFFEQYKSELELGISTFFRYGDNQGNITNDRIFSFDNILMYNSLLKNEFNGDALVLFYNGLKQSALWFDGNETEFMYGFMEALNGTTGNVHDDKRNLVDNLLPIFLLCSITPSQYKTEAAYLVEKMFSLLNSSQYYNSSIKGFYEYNNSQSYKYASTQFYSILANFLIHRNDVLGISGTVKQAAYVLANETMNMTIKYMWDNDDLGFYDWVDEDWAPSIAGSQYKRLDVNALGIMALVESWLMTGKVWNSSFIENATMLFNKLNSELWNSSYGAYEFRRESTWAITGTASDRYANLDANSLMMRACLKLYDATGNLTYLDKALELYKTFEDKYYNQTLHAYITSIGVVNDTSINLRTNLMVCEAYVDALENMKYTSLFSSYNVSYSGDGPDYILNEDTLNLTSYYDYIKTNWFYNTTVSQYQPYTIRTNITNANITYIIKYPNSTIFSTIKSHIHSDVTVGSIAEETKITCINDTNGILNGTYFLINTPNIEFFVWFNVSGNATSKPNLPGKTGIEIKNVSINATKEQVASNVSTYLVANGNFSVSLLGDNITITNLLPGNITHATDGIIKTNFTFEVMVDGTNRSDTTNVLLHEITEDFAIGDGYQIHIYANTTYYSMAYLSMKFNVISGISNQPIQGLGSPEQIYQGQTKNFTIPFDSTRSHNITLNVSLEGTGITDVIKTVNITLETSTSVELNITVDIDAPPGVQTLEIKVKNGSYVYLSVSFQIEIVNALNYNNLIISNNVISGENIDLSLNLINYLPSDPQSLNISFTGTYIQDVKSPVDLVANEIKTVSFSLSTQSGIVESTISIEMSISKGETVFYTSNLIINILPKLAIISATFPAKIAQGEIAYLIIIINNNQKTTENFTLSINGANVTTSIPSLSPGENRILSEIQPSINPYDFSSYSYQISIQDGSNAIIYTQTFGIALELSTSNFLLFYILPCIIPIGIIIFFKNKDIKVKKLR